MLDFRAWIIAGLILLTAAGAYVIWITRPRAVYSARSLSASGNHANSPVQPLAQNLTKSLHVEGCKEDFIVSPGELVEPTAVPGAALEQFRNLYGLETKREAPNVWQWKQEAFWLTDGDFGPQNPSDFVQISMNTGHIVETLDGIELGLDSFGTIFRKMQDKKVEIHERIERTESHWMLIVTMYSACGRKYRSEYTRTIPSDPEVDRQIAPLALTNAGANGQTGQAGLWRSDVFMNKVAYDYAMKPSGGTDNSTAGTPSEHD
jgi:hypothetical protein